MPVHATSDPPAPPTGFRGAFRADPIARARVTGASGPFRLEPLAVATPRDIGDIATLLAWARDHHVPLFPRGAGTGMPGGNVGRGVCLDLTGWDDIGPVDREARTIEVGPGAVAARVDARARRAGLCIPALPSSADRCTLGGMVANNAAGARTFRHGPIRDRVEGLHVVFADGDTSRVQRGDRPPIPVARAHATGRAMLGPRPAWPDVRKNASGYALDRFLPSGDGLDLLVGSEGTLAVVTGIRLALEPVPTDTALVLIPIPTADQLAPAIQAVGEAHASACEFFASRFLDLSGLRTDPELGALVGSAHALLLAEVEGGRDDVDAGAAALAALADQLGVSHLEARDRERQARVWDVRHAASPVIAAAAEDGRVSMQFIEDSVVPPHLLGTYLGALDEILTREETDAVMFGHAGDGNAHVNPLVDVRRPDWRARVGRILHATVDLVARLGGTLSGEHGDGRLRAPFHERIFGQAVTSTFQAVKDLMDPAGILNPGVLVALPGQDPLDGLSPTPRSGR